VTADLTAELGRLERARSNPGSSPALGSYIDRMLAQVRSQLSVGGARLRDAEIAGDDLSLPRVQVGIAPILNTKELARASALRDFHARELAKLGPEPDT
jgi:hypothetical protein